MVEQTPRVSALTHGDSLGLCTMAAPPLTLRPQSRTDGYGQIGPLLLSLCIRKARFHEALTLGFPFHHAD